MKTAIPSAQELLQAGVHFGHQTRRWHPKMDKYIHKKHSGIHVIDLFKTKELLEEAAKFAYETARTGKKVIFVGTKEQVKEVVEIEAKRSGALFVTERWFGGTLTNFERIKDNRQKMLDLKAKMEDGTFKDLTKRERLLISRDIEKLDLSYGGLVGLHEQPGVLFIVDPRKEKTAVKEALLKNVPIIALIDTNTDPTKIDYPIPGNDDAIKSVALITRVIADAILEGYKDFASAEKTKVVVEEGSAYPELAGRDTEKKAATKEKNEPKVVAKADKKEKLLKDSDLSVKTVDALKAAKISNRSQLDKMSDEELEAVKGISTADIKEIKHWLQ